MDFHCSHCDETTPHAIEKYCPKCGKTLPHTAFHKNKAQPDGLASHCKDCRNAHNKTPKQREKNNEYMREWNDRNREKINAKAVEAYWKREERRKSDPELDTHLRALARARSRRAYSRNPQKALAAMKAWVNTNLAQLNASRRQRYKDNPDPIKAQNIKRYSLRKGVQQEPYDFEAIKAAYGYRCVYCPPDCLDCRKGTHELHRDHIIPLNKGGPDIASNVAPACPSCNGRKQDGPVLRSFQPPLFL